LYKLGYRFVDPVKTATGYDFSKVVSAEELEEEITEYNIPTHAEMITELTVEAAQVIQTNLYKNNYHLGNHTIDEVRSNPDFFSKARPFWYSEIKQKSDLLVRRSNGTFNITVCPTLEAARQLGYGTEIKVLTDGKYRLDVNGKRMYKLPESKYVIYQNDEGQEVIVLYGENQDQIKENLITILRSIPDLTSVQPLV
jgi:hypothetical protein